MKYKFARLFRRRAALKTPLDNLPTPDRGAELPAEPYLRLFAELGTGLWRLRQKGGDGTGITGASESRRTTRQIDSMWDALHQNGFEIIDLTNAPYQSGMSLKVIAFQPTPGLGREVIIEVIRPMIYLHKTLIQMGEVIVGTPEIVDIPTEESPVTTDSTDSAPQHDLSDSSSEPKQQEQ